MVLKPIWGSPGLIELSKILKILFGASLGIQLHTEFNSIINNKLYGLTNCGHAHTTYKRLPFPCYNMKNNINCSCKNVLFT